MTIDYPLHIDQFVNFSIEQPGNSEQFCIDQKVHYHQVCLYLLGAQKEDFITMHPVWAQIGMSEI